MIPIFLSQGPEFLKKIQGILSSPRKLQIVYLQKFVTSLICFVAQPKRKSNILFLKCDNHDYDSHDHSTLLFYWTMTCLSLFLTFKDATDIQVWLLMLLYKHCMTEDMKIYVGYTNDGRYFNGILDSILLPCAGGRFPLHRHGTV